MRVVAEQLLQRRRTHVPETRGESLDEGPIGRDVPRLVAPSGEYREAPASCGRGTFQRQARLPGARLACQRDHATATGREGFDGGLDLRKFVLAADEGRLLGQRGLHHGGDSPSVTPGNLENVPVPQSFQSSATSVEKSNR